MRVVLLFVLASLTIHFEVTAGRLNPCKECRARHLRCDGTPSCTSCHELGIKCVYEARAAGTGACHSCKRKHLSCNQMKPECSTCEELGEECSYPPRKQRRTKSKKQKANDELKELEKEIASSPDGDNSDGDDDITDSELKKLEEEIEAYPGYQELSLEDFDGDDSDDDIDDITDAELKRLEEEIESYPGYQELYFGNSDETNSYDMDETESANLDNELRASTSTTPTATAATLWILPTTQSPPAPSSTWTVPTQFNRSESIDSRGNAEDENPNAKYLKDFWAYYDQ